MRKDLMNNEQELYASVMYYALKRDLEIVDEEMQQNEPLTTNEANSEIKNFWDTKVVNINRRKKMNQLSVRKTNVLDQIEKFKEAQSAAKVDFSYGETQETLTKKLAKTFGGNNRELDKAYFAIRFCLDNTVTFENEEEVWAEISKLLFDDEHTIAHIYNDLQENYLQIYREPFDTVQTAIMAGVSLASLLSAIALPMLLGAQSTISPVLSSCLSQIGRSAAGNVGMGILNVTTQAAVYSTLLLGGTYLGTEMAKQLKIKNMRENFRKISPEELSMMLAIKATIIQYAQTRLSKDEMKNVLDDCLSHLNDLRSDAEYVLIVERLDAENSKKKIEICNRVTNRLAYIVGL